jgi:phospholipid/cholesterol/gamma-HCH transport system substrate-binding protein
MKRNSSVEIGTGLFVLLGFAALFFMATQISSHGFEFGRHDYHLSAQFDNVGGLKAGAPVSIGGVTIGRVESIDYDSSSFKAVVRLAINQRYNQVPNDSDAAIYTAGLLGGNYVGFTPGGSDTPYKEGDRIEMTQSAIVLENLISKFLFDKAGQGAKKE